MYSKSEVIKMLATSSYNVTFTKKDGTIRTMNCTRKQSLIPANDYPTSNTNQVESVSDNIKVYDLDKSAWRSFNLNAVTTIQSV